MGHQPRKPQPRKFQPTDISLSESFDIAFYEALFSDNFDPHYFPTRDLNLLTNNGNVLNTVSSGSECAQ